MNNNKIKVLLCEASGRQVLPIAKGFHKLNCIITTVQGKRSDLGAVSRYANKKYIVKDVDCDADVAAAFYRKLIYESDFDLAVPLSDFSAGILANMKSDIEKNTKTKIAANEIDVFMQAFDKLNTMKACMSNKIGCPFTLDAISGIADVPDDIKYPLLIKPRSSCGSIGIHMAQNREELHKYIEHSQNEKLGPVLVQEFIPQNGKQYNAHFFIDKNGNIKTALLTQKCRWFPIDGGAGTLCRTVHRNDILEMCTKLLGILKWRGYCDIDLMEDPRDNSIRIIEINARISANVKLCFVSGIDITEQLLNLYLGGEVKDYTNYPDDIRLRCIHTDLLWFLKSKDRFKTDPSWFSITRTYDQIFSLTDPLPFIAFSITALLKYKNEMKKRKRTI